MNCVTSEILIYLSLHIEITALFNLDKCELCNK